MRVTIARKLAGTFAIIFLLMIAAAGISFYKLHQLAAAQERMTEGRLPVFAATYDLRVVGSLTENAVTFLTNSALVLPAESVEWVRSAKHYDRYGTTEAQARPEGHR